MTTGLMISWVRDHGRSRSLAQELDLEPVFVTALTPSAPAILRYLVSAGKTLALLARRRPRLVVIMLPPFPLLVVAWLYCTLTRSTLLGDAHTGVFLHPNWLWATGPTLRLLRRHAVVVTNEGLAERSRAAGVRTHVLHDVLRDQRHPASPAQDRPLVLCPLSYEPDEPLDALFEAVASSPDKRWVLTGSPPEQVTARAPEGAEFSGYVSDDGYRALVDGAAVIVALTTRDFTMQRAGYEALMVGVPQVTSDFPVLRDYYGDAAVFVPPTDGKALAAAVDTAVREGDRLRRAADELLERRLAEQEDALDDLRSAVCARRPAVR